MSSPIPLRYGSDQEVGIRRRGSRRFHYVNERTGKEASADDRRRIAALAIPPAWTDVWIAASPDSHVQATGRDARGRKQYRYHPQHTAERSAHKFDDLVTFAEHLGPLRRHVRRDLATRGLGHDRLVAVVVRLLDLTGLRVGNDEYVRANRTYGITTLRTRHVTVRGSTIQLRFRGKVTHEFDVRVEDPTLARIVRRCQHLPGQDLFRYQDEAGEVRTVTSDDVNRYLREHGAPNATAKTFRTWNATVGAASGLAAVAKDEPAPTVHTLNQVIDTVALALGNTRAVCRGSYIHPAVIDAYFDEKIAPNWSRPVGTRPVGLLSDERRALRVIR